MCPFCLVIVVVVFLYFYFFGSVSRRRSSAQDPDLPLAFGNFGSGFKADDRLLRGKMYNPQVFATALSPAEVVAVQARAGCAPTCAAGDSCGSDGCGGTCGAPCTGVNECRAAESGGPRHCFMPSSVTVAGFYDGNGVYKVSWFVGW